MKTRMAPERNNCFAILILGCFAFFGMRVQAQTNIPVGTWRLHLSYNNIQHVEVTDDRVFAASKSGILIFDRKEKILNTYNKLNGLSSTGISSLRYDEANDQLLIGYDGGDLDIIRESTVTNFDRLKDADVTTSKKINHISIRDNIAYLSTAYGVVLFDLVQLEIKETWRDLGPSGETLLVYQSTFLKDSIFLTSVNGVLAGFMNDNLLDYNNWKRFDEEIFSDSSQAIATFNDKVYAAGVTGLYRFGGHQWIREPFLQTAFIHSLASSAENLLMLADSSMWSLSVTHELSEISDVLVNAPVVIKQDASGNFWIGDRSAGLVSNTGGMFSSYLPNGPTLSNSSEMVFNDGKLFAFVNGFCSSGPERNIPGAIDFFEDGGWNTITAPVSNVTDIAFRNDQLVVSSPGSGIVMTDFASGNNTILDETNSPLIDEDTTTSTITAIEGSTEGLWVANYEGQQSLHLFKNDGTWESFSFNYPNQQHPTDLSVDGNGDVWMVLNPESGGGLIAFDRSDGHAYYKTNAAGSGALPNLHVRCITTDRDGYTWVGTDAGVAYFFSSRDEAIKPIYESRFLLRDETVTALAVDAGNRKWIGTEQGVWLFNPTGEDLIHHFHAENSPLLSNVIRGIEINSLTGEVFFATDLGLVSYRSDAVTAEAEFEKIKIFPNPVHPGFNGTLAISGLASNALVRITDISGKLIWQTQANGGMATWNVRDNKGRRPATGVYLVFAVKEDGSQSIVGKIAVIE